MKKRPNGRVRNRVRLVNISVWVTIVTVIVSSRIGRIETVDWTAVVTLVMASFGVAIALRRQIVLYTISLMMALVVMGGVYGFVFSAWCPGHPQDNMGVSTQLIATVTSTKVKGKTLEVMLHVTRDGARLHRCSYTALWIPSQHASQATIGERVSLRGVFLQFSTPTTGFKEWLAPVWLFRGQMESVATTGRASAVLSSIRTALEQTLPSPSSAMADLALSMVIGRAATVSAQTQTLFLQAGVTHMLAASGANVALVCRFASLLWGLVFRWFGIRVHALRHLYLLAVIWTFVCLCGVTTPITRAAMLVSYMMIAKATHRQVSSMTALSVSCLFFAVCRPYDFTTASGVLSLVATFAVYQSTSRHRHTMRQELYGQHSAFHNNRVVIVWLWEMAKRVFHHCLELFIVSFMVDIYMLPLVWWWFQQLTPYGALSTVMLEPMLFILLPMTIAWGVFAELYAVCHVSILYFGASALARMVVMLLQIATGMLRYISSRPFSLNQMPNLPLWAMILYFAAVILWQRIRFPTLQIRLRPKYRREPCKN